MKRIDRSPKSAKRNQLPARAAKTNSARTLQEVAIDQASGLPAGDARMAKALGALLLARSGLKPGASAADIAAALGFRIVGGGAKAEADDPKHTVRFCIPVGYGSPVLLVPHANPPDADIARGIILACVDFGALGGWNRDSRFLRAAAEALVSPDAFGLELADLAALRPLPMRLPPFDESEQQWKWERPYWTYFGARGVAERTWRRATETPVAALTGEQRKLLAGFHRWQRRQPRVAA